MDNTKYVSVPVEPTEEMLDVFHDKVRILCTPEKREASILNDKEVYKALIAAAPKAEQAQDEREDCSDYHAIFSSISDAVTWKPHKTLAISVQAFEDALGKFNRKVARAALAQKPEASTAKSRKPTGDELRAIASSVHGSTDRPQPTEYVLAGWKAALTAQPAQKPEDKAEQQQLSEEAILELAKKAGFHFHDAGYAPTLHTIPLEYSQKCFERFASALLNGGTE